MKEIFNSLIDTLRSLNIFSIVDRYKGEFDEGTDWNPVWPACYVRLTNIKPESISSGREVLKYRVSFTLYVANQDRDGLTILDLIEKVSRIITVDNRPIILVDISWAGYIKGTEIYTIEYKMIYSQKN